MKVFDVFPFFNEVDLLEIRLNLLDPYVDFFVLSEGTKDFQGNDKILYYQDNKDKFEKFNHKIIHNIVEDADKSVLSEYGRKYGTQIEAQQRDAYQKDTIKELLLKHVGDDDAIIWGDLDEVPNPDAVAELKSFFETDVIYHFAQENCISYLNLIEVTGILRAMTPDFDYGNDRPRWLGTKVFGKSILNKYELSQLRSKHENEKNSRIFPGGWHWSYVGSEGLTVEERLIKKCECSSHPEINNDAIKNNVSKVKDNIDPLGREYASYKVFPMDDSFPQYILDNLDKYTNLIKEY